MARTHTLAVLFGALVTLGQTPALLSAPYPFHDGFDGGLAAWTADAPWATTTARYSSPPFSVTDSPGGQYGNSTDSSLTLASGLDLTSAQHPVLVFHHRFALENGYDHGVVEVSTDGGATWSPPLASYTGHNGGWEREQLELEDVAGQGDVRIRFRLITDGSVTDDGWYLDDVTVAAPPQPVSLLTPATAASTSIHLSWSRSADQEFQAYRVYRSRSIPFDWHTASLLGELDDPGITEFTDVTASPKTTYTYAIMVLTARDTHSLSNTETVTTPAVLEYPFLDDAESGGISWIADAPWAITTEDAFSGSHAWSDSPGGDYANDVSASLTLASPVDLSAATSPVLSFEQRLSLASGDLASVEVSTDSGASWQPIATYGSSQTSGWRRERIDLQSYSGSPSLLVRFRIQSNASLTADGWYVDDISLGESPAMVGPPLVDSVTSRSIDLHWFPSTDPLFSRFALFRDTNPGVALNSELVAVGTDPGETSFTDTGLLPDTTYYYRLFVVSPWGTFSPATPSARSARTAANPIPFADGFEGSLENWTLTGTWGATDSDSHSGARSLTDSPDTPHASSGSSSAETTLDLRGTTWPVLSFWDRAALADGARGFVRIDTYGSPYSDRYEIYGTRVHWEQQGIDLSEWKDQPAVAVSFWLASSSQTPDDGWYVDDVTVSDLGPQVGGLPFLDDAENGLASWISTRWSISTENPHGGGACFRGLSEPGSTAFLGLAKELDLSTATEPFLAYFLRGTVPVGGSFAAQVSTDGGLHWTDLPGTLLDQEAGPIPGWTRYLLNLSSFSGSHLRLRFRLSCYSYATGPSEIFLDDVGISDAATDSQLLAPVPHLKSVDLSWTQSSAGSSFARYELYRQAPGEDPPGTLIFDSQNPAVTSFTDTGLIPGTDYSYRLFVVFQDQHVAASERRAVRTASLPVPTSDPMDTLDNWASTGEWGPDSDNPHEGSAALSDSPGHDYDASHHETFIETSVDLTGTGWPVLTFWDRFGFSGREDGGQVEIRCDDSTPVTIYQAVGERSYWSRNTLDLSSWKGCSNVHVRFLVLTDSGTAGGDGWHVDSLAFEDHAGSLALPFFDGAEGGDGNWLPSGWEVSTRDGYSGAHSFLLAIGGDPLRSLSYDLELGGELDLRGAVAPQLSYMAKRLSAGTCSAPGSSLSVSVSADGGLSWQKLTPSDSTHLDSNWRQVHVSLEEYEDRIVRLKLTGVSQHTTRCPGDEVYVDDVVISSAPEAVTLAAPAPHRKSVDLSWTEFQYPASFARYEVYRSTGTAVTDQDTLVYSTTSIDDTSFTDTGLEVGETYFYAVAVVDRQGMVAFSNVHGATTIPVALPLFDPMENLDNWSATGTWGPDADTPHGGSFSLSDSPGADTPPSSNTWIATAANLVGASWPVLRFWERSDLPEYGAVEVSRDGSSWTTVYGYQGGTATWEEQVIDLSPWRDAPALRLRFRVVANGYAPGDGWHLDDLTIEDLGAPSRGIPFLDGAETGLDAWLHLGWEASSDSPRSGSWCFRAPTPGTMAAYAPTLVLPLELAGAVDLSLSQHPSMGFWYQGGDFSASVTAQVSVDQGATWADVPGSSVTFPTGLSGWQLRLFSLEDFHDSQVRIRLLARFPRGNPPENGSLAIDDIFIVDALAGPDLAAPLPVVPNSLSLSWDAPSDPNFAAYRVLRSETPSVNQPWDVLTSISDPAQTTFTDTGLRPVTQYYYVVELVETTGVATRSQVASGMPPGMPLPFSDDFEEESGAWYLEDGWLRAAGEGYQGSYGLVDSAGDYPRSWDRSALLALDLSGTSWPVLTFRNRYDFASGDFASVVITDGENESVTVYSANGGHPDWGVQAIDLSPWRNLGPILVRLNVDSNSDGNVDDGWHVDDVSVTENSATGPIVLPFLDGLENGLDSWLASGWELSGDDPAEGSRCLVVPPAGAVLPFASLSLVLARPLDLEELQDPVVSYRLRGTLSSRASLRAAVSSDGGVHWNTVGSINGAWSSETWQHVKFPLEDYHVHDLRFRLEFKTYSLSEGRLFIDTIAIASERPTAPIAESPAQHEDVPDGRPTLVVANATDFQGDALFYEFQVFDDAALTHQVAGIPAIAEQPVRTAWTPPVTLPSGAQYWWRCRATDDEGHQGPWMNAATFFVNVANRPPTAPQLISPQNGEEIHDLTGRLTWLSSSDPDEADGDFVAGYRVQVDDGPSFASPEIDHQLSSGVKHKASAVSVMLGELTGAPSLTHNHRYYWRVAALDDRGAASQWSAGPAYFVYGVDSGGPICTILEPGAGSTVTADPLPIRGTAVDTLSGIQSVEVSADGGATWIPAGGGEEWLLRWPAASSGDYELSCRARDISGNLGPASSPVGIHADLTRSVGFPAASSWIPEHDGTASVALSLDAPRSVPVSVDLVLQGGTATPGEDFSSPAETVVFAPGQTTSIIEVTITDDPVAEPNETVVLGLANPSPPDITVVPNTSFTVTIVNDDSRADLDLDGTVTGNDMVVLIRELFDLDGTSTDDVPGSSNPGWHGYDLDGDGHILAADVAEEIRAMGE